METGNGGYARAHVQSSLLWPPRGKSAFHRRSRHGLVHQRHIPARWRHGGLYGEHAEADEPGCCDLLSSHRRTSGKYAALGAIDDGASQTSGGTDHAQFARWEEHTSELQSLSDISY